MALIPGKLYTNNWQLVPALGEPIPKDTLMVLVRKDLWDAIRGRGVEVLLPDGTITQIFFGRVGVEVAEPTYNRVFTAAK